MASCIRHDSWALYYHDPRLEICLRLYSCPDSNSCPFPGSRLYFGCCLSIRFLGREGSYCGFALQWGVPSVRSGKEVCPGEDL